MYPHDRPNRLARALNSLSVVQFRSGVLASRRWVVMEVRGYRSGRVVSCPLVVAPVAGHRYLVSIRRYLDFAPGARPHIPVDRHAPVEEFEKIADRIPVFRVTADGQ